VLIRHSQSHRLHRLQSLGQFDGLTFGGGGGRLLPGLDATLGAKGVEVAAFDERRGNCPIRVLKGKD